MRMLQQQMRAAEVAVVLAPIEQKTVTTYGQMPYGYQPGYQQPNYPYNQNMYGHPAIQPYGPHYNQPYNPIGQPINPMIQQPPTNQPMLAKQI